MEIISNWREALTLRLELVGKCVITEIGVWYHEHIAKGAIVDSILNVGILETTLQKRGKCIKPVDLR